MISNTPGEHTSPSPMSIPEELKRNCGEFFKIAREKMDISRGDVECAGDLEHAEIVTFELGSRTLTEELWEAYVKAVEEASQTGEFTLVNASELLRGLVNEMRAKAA